MNLQIMVVIIIPAIRTTATAIICLCHQHRSHRHQHSLLQNLVMYKWQKNVANTKETLHEQQKIMFELIQIFTKKVALDDNQKKKWTNY